MESYERLKAVIGWAGLSTHAFALHVGMKRSENLYRIIRNEENMSIKLVSIITKTYSEINKNWLLCGDGEMLVKNMKIIEDSDLIPYYSSHSEKGIELLKESEPNFNLYIPVFTDVDIAITMNDRAMEPIIPFRAILILSKKPTDIILFGHIYYIETETITMIRVVRKSEKSDDEITLDVFNNDRYDSITMPKNQIKKMALVCGSVNQFI